MKKLLAILVAIGIILGGGATVSASASDNYPDWPVTVIPPQP